MVVAQVAELNHLDGSNSLAGNIEIPRPSQALVVVLLERNLFASDRRLQQRIGDDSCQGFPAIGVLRQNLEMAIGRLIGDVR